METVQLDNETTVTQIGVLEWAMNAGYVSPSHLKHIRPTVKEDMDGERLTTKAYDMNLVHHLGGLDDAIISAMVYVIVAVIRQLKDDGIDGKVLLCLAKRQQRWNMMIVCNAYKPRHVQAMNFRYFWNTYIRAPILRPYWRWKHLTFTCDAGMECDWVHPYGFVPEDGCPIHDK